MLNFKDNKKDMEELERHINYIEVFTTEINGINLLDEKKSQESVAKYCAMILICTREISILSKKIAS